MKFTFFIIWLFRHFLRRRAATVTSRAMSPQAIKYRMSDLYPTSAKEAKEYDPCAGLS